MMRLGFDFGVSKAERLKAGPEVLDRRPWVVEHPFGSIKQRMYQGPFLMRGLVGAAEGHD